MKFRFFCLLALCCSLSLATLHAQTGTPQKIAYVDTDTLVRSMSDYKRAKSELEDYGKLLERRVKNEEERIQLFIQDAQRQADRLPPAQLRQKQEQLQRMQAEFQQLMAEVDQDLAAKEQELTKPIYERFEKAIAKVAKEQGYNYVFDKKFLMYSEGGINATDLVKKALEVQ